MPSRHGTLVPHTPANEADRGEKSGYAEAQQLPRDNAVNEKNSLQDQTNLLPVKQVLIVFVGLSCALFCKNLHTQPCIKNADSKFSL